MPVSFGAAEMFYLFPHPHIHFPRPACFVTMFRWINYHVVKISPLNNVLCFSQVVSPTTLLKPCVHLYHKNLIFFWFISCLLLLQ